jgi:Fe-S cluster assembly iron-binding protein IscA
MDVFVDGEALRRDGVTLTVDEKSAREELNELAIDYYSEL